MMSNDFTSVFLQQTDLTSIRKCLNHYSASLTEKYITAVLQDENLPFSSLQLTAFIFWAADRFPENADIVNLSNLCDRVQAFNHAKNKVPIDHMKMFVEFLDQKCSEKDECSICLKDLKIQHIPVRNLMCSHSFHSVCISKWKIQNTTCPLCRKFLL